MEIPDGLGLSPGKVAYLKYVILHNGTVRTSDIATESGVDPSTITKTLAELTGGGFLVHDGASLALKGRQYAGFLVKGHRILVLALTHHGLPDEEACTEVPLFESLVSKGAIDRMCHAMGHPHRSGCGEVTHDSGCLGHAK